MAPTPSRSPSRSRSPSKGPRSPSPEQSECPSLIRLFVTKGKHTPLADFDRGNFPVRDEFSAYGWKHSTPSSLLALLLPSFPPIYRSPVARYSFRHIYVDASARGLYKHADLISFTGKDLMATLEPPEAPSEHKVDMDVELDDSVVNGHGEGRGRKGRKIEEKTLDDYGFVIGDLLSVSVSVPEPRQPPKAGPPGATAAANGSFGWGERGAGAGAGAGGAGAAGGPDGGRRESRSGAPRDGGAWGRGEPLPPQNFRGPRGGAGRDDGYGGPGARRGGGRGGAFGSAGGFEGRPRSRSPPPHIDRYGGDGGRRRSRSPLRGGREAGPGREGGRW